MSKQKGIVRKIDPLGRLVIPKEIRKKLDLPENAEVEMTVENKVVMIRKYATTCTFCNQDRQEQLIAFMGRKICQDCLGKLKHTPFS